VRNGIACAAPVVSKVAANAVPSGSGTVTISGLSFGTGDLTATASLATADVCGSSAWTSATTVACAPPAYSGSAVRTAVSMGAVMGTVAGQFSFDGARAKVGCPSLKPSRGRQWEAYAQLSFCSSGRVFLTKCERSRIGRSAAYHLRLAVWDLRPFGFSFTGQRLVFYDELDLSDLGGLHRHVQHRRRSVWSSNRRFRYYWNRVLYCF
jgi:hypothetical protein